MTNLFEDFLLDIGLSWTLAKYSPYLLCLLLGYAFFQFVIKRANKIWVKLVLSSVLFCLPFGVYFFFYPIYQPDLFNKAYAPKMLPTDIPSQTTLAVVVLPGCPYCLQTTAVMNRLAAQNMKLHIVYYFVSEDPEAMRIFRRKLNKRIALKSGIDATRWMIAAEGVFPSYLLFDHKQLKRAWHNTTFGVRALDELRAYK